MPVLVTWKLDDDPIENKGTIVSTKFSSSDEEQVTPKSMNG